VFCLGQGLVLKLIQGPAGGAWHSVCEQTKWQHLAVICTQSWHSEGARATAVTERVKGREVQCDTQLL